MKFIVDADLPYSLIEVFKHNNHDVKHVSDVMKFALDDEILNYANKNSYIIVTRDLGFAEAFLKNKGYGLILVRLPYYFKAEKVCNVFNEFLREIDAKILINSITVVELGKYRIKKI